MSSHRNESLGTHQQIERHTQQIGKDRRGLIAFLTLVSLAFPALGIRYLVPDLNPLFLAGLGVAVYGVYLGLLAYYSFQSNDVELATEPVVSNARDRRLVNDVSNP